MHLPRFTNEISAVELKGKCFESQRHIEKLSAALLPRWEFEAVRKVKVTERKNRKEGRGGEEAINFMETGKRSDLPCFPSGGNPNQTNVKSGKPVQCKGCSDTGEHSRTRTRTRNSFNVYFHHVHVLASMLTCNGGIRSNISWLHAVFGKKSSVCTHFSENAGVLETLSEPQGKDRNVGYVAAGLITRTKIKKWEARTRYLWQSHFMSKHNPPLWLPGSPSFAS